MASEREHSSIDRSIISRASYATEAAPDSDLRPAADPAPDSSPVNGKEGPAHSPAHGQENGAASPPLQQPDSMKEIEAFLDLALKELSALRTRSEQDAVNRAAGLALKDPKNIELLARAGQTPLGGTPEDLTRRIVQEYDTYARLIHDTGLKLE